MARKSKSAAEETFLAMREDIISGKLHGGRALVEDELAEMYKVSRTPIREAIKNLQAEGLVISYPYKGSFVKEFRERDIVEIYTVRKALEGISCRAAASIIRDDTISSLEENQRKSEEALLQGSVVLAGELGDNLHSAILQISDNSQVTTILRQLKGPQEYFNRITAQMEGRLARSIQEHQAILDALKAHDADQAEKMMRIHLDSTMDEMLSSIRNARVTL